MRATMLSIDPGEKHCGMAYWIDGKLQWTMDLDPPGLYRWLMNHEPTPSETFEVVMEAFKLYPWKSDAQAFSELRTVEVIGVVKFLCEVRKVFCTMQDATIKKPTFGIMRSRGVEVTGNQHEKDAVAHGYHRIHRRSTGSEDLMEKLRTAPGGRARAKIKDQLKALGVNV